VSAIDPDALLVLAAVLGAAEGELEAGPPLEAGELDVAALVADEAVVDDAALDVVLLEDGELEDALLLEEPHAVVAKSAATVSPTPPRLKSRLFIASVPFWFVGTAGDIGFVTVPRTCRQLATPGKEASRLADSSVVESSRTVSME
jgi:hypothetical protein